MVCALPDSFVTAPTAAVYPTTFAFFADMGSECNTPGCSDKTIQALQQATEAHGFDFLVHAGDIAYTSGTQSIWDDFLNQVQPFAARLPYQVCPGNHEHYFNFTVSEAGGSCWPRVCLTCNLCASLACQGYDSRFSMGGQNGANNFWSSFDFGPVHFLSFSTEHPYEEGTPQHDFIEADLKAASANRDAVPFIFMYGHRPLYCSTE